MIKDSGVTTKIKDEVLVFWKQRVFRCLKKFKRKKISVRNLQQCYGREKFNLTWIILKWFGSPNVAFV